MESQLELPIKDLGEASTLLTLGYKLLRLEPSKTGTHKLFIFRDVHDSTITLRLYRSHEIKVDAYQFFMNTKELKSRIHDMNDSAS